MTAPMKARWTKLLSETRAQQKGPVAVSTTDLRTAFEADYDRVVYSTPFRRLAKKTQVHPFAQNDHVRTRLTHSLEVSCVGRSFATRLAKRLAQDGTMPENRTDKDLYWIMLSACCAHDIGNPPLGHAGEEAIRAWVTEHPEILFPEGPNHVVTEAAKSDFRRFEGNAQGFRLAARNDNDKTGYIHLTYASLGAMIKYPWDSGDSRARDKKDKWKYNVFSTESKIFASMWDEMGLYKDGKSYRHPLSYLTEAADDICYRMLDLEDALELDVLLDSEVRGVYSKIAGLDSENDMAMPRLRGKAIAALIDGTWSVFDRDYDKIMEGHGSKDLVSGLGGALGDGMKEINDKWYPKIFADHAKVAAELGAYKAIGRIIKALCAACKAMVEKGGYDGSGFLAQRCVDLTWGSQYAKKKSTLSYQEWLYQIFDYISGLTDNRARQLSREIEGT